MDPNENPAQQKTVESRMQAMQMKAEKKRLLEQFSKVSGGREGVRERGSEGNTEREMFTLKIDTEMWHVHTETFYLAP